MYDIKIKLSNVCANYFAYYYEKFRNNQTITALDKKLSKMMDEEFLQYFSSEKNTRKYLTEILNQLIEVPYRISYFNYTSEEEKNLREIILLCLDDTQNFKIILDDLVTKNLIEVENAIEVFKAQNNGSLVVTEQNYYNYFERKMGIDYTTDEYSAKNNALKKKIIKEGVFSNEEIEILSKFCDWGGYMWMPIWKNIDNVKVLPTEEITSDFENKATSYVGKFSGDVITKNKFIIEVAGVKFSTIKSKIYDTNGFW